MSRKADELVQLEQPVVPLANVKKLLIHGGSLVTDDKVQFKADVVKAIQQSVSEFTTLMTTLALAEMEDHNSKAKNKRKAPSSDDLYHAIDDLEIPFIRQQVALRSVAVSRVRWLALAKKKQLNPSASASKDKDGKKLVDLNKLQAESDIEQDSEEEEEEEEGEEEEQEEEEEEEEVEDESD